MEHRSLDANSGIALELLFSQLFISTDSRELGKSLMLLLVLTRSPGRTQVKMSQISCHVSPLLLWSFLNHELN